MITFRTKISKDQAKDTGMAMVLILLLVGLFLKKIIFFKLALPILIINMIFPKIYVPLARLWLGLSNLIGTIVSRILLSIIFFLIVTPIGLIRRLLGKDTLKLKEFKKGNASVMQTRNITFAKGELERPF